MGKSGGTLAILDVPFGYAIAGFLSLYLVEAEVFFSLDRLGFITLLGSLIASVFVAYDPINRHFLPFLVKRFFAKNNVLYSLQLPQEVKRHLPKFEVGGIINFSSYAFRALNSKNMGEPKRKIRSVILLNVTVAITALIFLVNPPDLLVKTFTLEQRVTLGVLLSLTYILLFVPLAQEIRQLPLKLYLEALYLLGAEGLIEPGLNFNKLEESLDSNDWPAAETWAARWFMESKFFPRWPSAIEIPELVLEEMLELFVPKKVKRKPNR